MTTKTYRIPKANIAVIEHGGHRYIDTTGLELWLRRIADSLQSEDAPTIIIATVNTIADQFAKEPTP